MILKILKFLCRRNIHGIVEIGGGLGHDCHRCLLCGFEKYPENFGISIVKLDIVVCRKIK